jgi:phosphoglycolate phosphatase-like HAD superfamily hydrolase
MTDLPAREGIKVVALDWDGTLVDSVPGKLAQNLAIAHEFGNTECTEEDVRREWNAAPGFSDLMHRLTGSHDMDAIMEVIGRDYDNPAYAKRPFDFALSALQTMRQSGKKLAVVTSVNREILDKDVPLGLNVSEEFDFLQTTDDCPYKKPDPRVFGNLLAHFGITPEELIYTGDELKDHEATSKAGAHFVGVLTGMTSAKEFDRLHVPHVADLGALALQLRSMPSN